MALEKQINIYSVDTGNFYSNRERHLHWLNHKLRRERNSLKAEITKVLSELEPYNIFESDFCGGVYTNPGNENMEANKLVTRYFRLNELLEYKNEKIKDSKDRLLALLSNKVENNICSQGKHHTRILNEKSISEKNIISVFDSFLTRTIGAKQDELTDSFMVVQVYYFDVIKDLIHFGFTYKGERYIYFTSSAGQIRTKKTVFIKESVWTKIQKTIMCGLTLDAINEKGGNNPNKHLAYMALANSATDVWNEFDIDKSIVIDDFETEVFGTYDLIDDIDYSIKRTEGNIPIAHTDGAGMMLPALGKNRMVRLPWVKGLLGAFDFVKFIQVHECSPVIKDIYGQEHDVIAEGIQIIFTKSQFKMHQYYDSWEQYKAYYKRYGCSAGNANMEEDRIKDVCINYQMLQTLTDVTDEEIRDIASKSVNKLNSLCSSIDNVKAAFGVTPYNTHKTYLQQAIELYPDLLNDLHMKIHLRSIKDSMVKRFKSGKLDMRCKYTFILPDFFAACEHWFLHQNNPRGLLGNSEVFCWLFRKNDKLDCLRSPHLFREHAVRENLACNGYENQGAIREWFGSNALYTSCHDLISKVLQFDCDGDFSLVVADKTLISIAERNMEGVVPLYYNMKKAAPTQLNNHSIYEGLNASFSGTNIGLYSNNISKIWNSDIFQTGTEEEKAELIDTVKLLCMENNFCIDAAKTLYMPQRPRQKDKMISMHTNASLPHFFRYAKDKELIQVEPRNNSLVNKLEDIIPNPRLNLRKIGFREIDYTLLMHNPDIECRVAFDDRGRMIKTATDPMIVRYCELNKSYHFKIDLKDESMYSVLPVGMQPTNTQLRYQIYYKGVSEEIRSELSKYGYSDQEIADILVKFLYGIKRTGQQESLWFCYGDIILENLRQHVKPKTKDIQCVDCGEWIVVGKFNGKSCRCQDCKQVNDRKRKREWKSRQTLSEMKTSTNPDHKEAC